jgi:protein-S-isoprenylcysteine O-methyltransferase
MNAGKARSIFAILVLYVLLPAIGRPVVLLHAKIWILWVIGALAFVFQPPISPMEGGRPQDRGSFRLIVWSIYLTQMAGVLEANYLRFPESYAWSLLSWVALAVSLSGLALRSWAVQTLGSFFTVHVQILDNHKVVTDGPYRYLRHPGYVGALLLYLGLLLFVGSYWSLLTSIVILPIIFLYRVRVEERVLIERLGEPYQRYRVRVGALFPRLW